VCIFVHFCVCACGFRCVYVCVFLVSGFFCVMCCFGAGPVSLGASASSV